MWLMASLINGIGLTPPVHFHSHLDVLCGSYYDCHFKLYQYWLMNGHRLSAHWKWRHITTQPKSSIIKQIFFVFSRLYGALQKTSPLHRTGCFLGRIGIQSTPAHLGIMMADWGALRNERLFYFISISISKSISGARRGCHRNGGNTQEAKVICSRCLHIRGDKELAFHH